MAEAKAIVNKNIRLTLDLSASEAKTLLLMMQNPMRYADRALNETLTAHEVRFAIFSSLRDAIS